VSGPTRSSARGTLALLAIAVISCRGARAPDGGGGIEAARSAGQRSNDGENIGRWLLAEMVSKDGDVAKAREARARLEKDGTLGRIASHIQTEKTLQFVFDQAQKHA